MSKNPKLTTTAGAPVSDNQNSMTAGPRGPVLMQDYQLLEKLAHQNRERIPERVVHAKGWGAFGTLKITHDITKYSKAKVFAEAIGITGVVLSKLDGSAKGGIVISVQKELGVPVKLVGLGEGPDDLAPFDPEGFVDGILA